MSAAGFLEKLLDGAEVAWVPLGDIAQYSTTRIGSDQLNESNYVGVDNLLQNRAGRVDSNYVPTSGNLTEFKEGDVLVGNIRPYLRKIWLADRRGGTNGDVLVVHPTSSVLNSRYLFQVLTDEDFFEYNIQHSKGAKMPRGSKPHILQYLVPIPCPEDPAKSLAIQGEIVRILDSFTALTAELTAELTARKKQYNHYRDQLLTFDEDEVEWKTLGELVETVTPPTRLKSDAYRETGALPIIDQGANYLAGYTDEEVTPVSDGEYVIFGDHSEHIKYVDFAFVQGADGLKILNPKKAIAKYLFYAFQSHYRKEGNYKRHWSKAKETLIPIPFAHDSERSLLEQARIVAILDKFNTLTTSLTEGLPREIALREKQYAYYRDQLLNFLKPDEMVA